MTAGGPTAPPGTAAPEPSSASAPAPAPAPSHGTPRLAALAARWRLLRSGPADGATNMALDAALLAEARRSGTATLRLYTWARPTLSLGRHERALGRIDPARCAAAGVDVVRRPTGGRALLHHRELTYAVAAPAHEATLRESFAAINALLLAGLRRLGVTAEEAAGGPGPARRRPPRPLRPEGAACFAEPSAGELVAGGAKLVGSAQLREEGALLQHGSILLADDQGRIAALRHADAPPLPATARAATLEGQLGRPVSADEVADALEAALGEALGEALGGVPAALDVTAPSLRDDLARLVIAFADPSWTWRR